MCQVLEQQRDLNFSPSDSTSLNMSLQICLYPEKLKGQDIPSLTDSETNYKIHHIINFHRRESRDKTKKLFQVKVYDIPIRLP